jgi:transposase InsO family protein
MFTRTRFQNGSNNHQGGIAERKEIIDRTHELPIVQQCQILELARSTAYYQPQPISVEDLALMRRIDALHMDWASRRVLSWRMSNTLTTDFCIEAVQEAINRYGEPEIFNTDQGCQFTSLEFTGLLKDNGIQISMDGKGCWRDNVFVERLWRSVKYEEVYLHAYDSVSDARGGLGKYFTKYNQLRPHSALDDKTPDEFYSDNLPALLKAA